MQVMPAAEGKQLAQKSKLAETLYSCLVAFFEPEVRAWRGEARLWTVFWFHGVLVSSVLIAFYVSSIYRSEAPLEQALLICFGVCTIWILVSIWRCSLFWLVASWRSREATNSPETIESVADSLLSRSREHAA